MQSLEKLKEEELIGMSALQELKGVRQDAEQLGARTSSFDAQLITCWMVIFAKQALFRSLRVEW